MNSYIEFIEELFKRGAITKTVLNEALKKVNEKCALKKVNEK